MKRHVAGQAALLWSLLAGCAEAPSGSELVESAEFGVFYGSQIQERDEIPFEVDPTKQRHGFRLELAQPAKGAIPVTWEIDMPNKLQQVSVRARHPDGARVAKLGRQEMLAGQAQLEQAFAFDPGDALGIWNFRVVAGGELVIDRSILVYDSVARARSRNDSEP